jgi:outer membrane protein, heavy metal efflux system
LEREAFVREVLRKNPSLAAARHGVRAALARARQAGALEDPMLDLGVAPLSIARKDVPFGYEIAVSQRLPWFGKRALESTLASTEASVEQADYELMRRELALGAASLYEQYYVAVRSLEINAQHRELVSAMREAAAAQLEGGRGSAQEPLQAEAELLELERGAIELESARDVTVAQMNELLHRAPELGLPPPPRELPTGPEGRGSTGRGSAAELAQRALNASPELAVTRLRIRAEQVKAERASRDAYPDFTVAASYNSMWDMPEHRWMVGVGLNLPLHSARRSAARDEALARRAQLESEAERQADAARTRVLTALQQLRKTERVVALYETRLLPVARDQISAAQSAFAVSRAPLFSLLEAERNLRRVELDYQLLRAEQQRQHAELERALGRIPGIGEGEVGR